MVTCALSFAFLFVEGDRTVIHKGYVSEPFTRSALLRQSAQRIAHEHALFRLRGGADEKIEGHCIGIDLGTTYMR